MHKKRKSDFDAGTFLLERFQGRSLRVHAANIPKEYFQMSKFKLEKLVKPTICLIALKQRFWQLNLEWQPGIKYSVHDCHSEICTYQYFYQGVVKNPAKFCWLLRSDVYAPILYDDARDLLFLKLYEVINLPVSKNKKVISKNVNAIIAAVSTLLDLVENEI